jgi:hypothetical protein
MPLADIDYVEILDAETLESIPLILPGKNSAGGGRGPVRENQTDR